MKASFAVRTMMLLSSAMAMPAFAQTVPPAAPAQPEPDIVVTGARHVGAGHGGGLVVCGDLPDVGRLMPAHRRGGSRCR